MDLEQQVCRVELAQELTDLGIGKSSYWQWRWRKNNWCLERIDSEIVPASEWFPAFTVAELGELLPQSIDETEISDKVGGKRYSLLIMNPRGSADGWMVGYGWLDLRLEYPKEWLWRERARKEADARAKMLIWLLLNELVCSDTTIGVKDDSDPILQPRVTFGLDVDEMEIDGNNVNHPDHYTSGGLEVIDIIEAKDLGYHLGNAVKYILRMGLKDPNKWAEDLEKAVWYIERYIQFRGKEERMSNERKYCSECVFYDDGDGDGTARTITLPECTKILGVNRDHPIEPQKQRAVPKIHNKDNNCEFFEKAEDDAERLLLTKGKSDISMVREEQNGDGTDS